MRPYVTAHGRFSRIRQVVPMCRHVTHMLPSAHLSPQPKRHLNRFGRFYIAHGRVLFGMPGHVVFPKRCSFACGIWSPSNTYFLGPIRVHNPKVISICSAVLHSSRIMGMSGHAIPLQNCPFPWGDLDPNPTQHSKRFSRFYTAHGRDSLLYSGPPIPVKIAHSHGECWPASNTWFFWPTQVLNTDGISIGSADFAGLTSVTDRQTDRPRYSVCNNRPHLSMYVVLRWGLIIIL